MSIFHYSVNFFVCVISFVGWVFDASPARADPINQLVDKTVAAMRDGEPKAAARYFLATHVSGTKNAGMILGVRMGIVFKIMKKNGWNLRPKDALEFGEQIAPSITKFDCQHPIFSEIVMHLLRNQKEEAAVQLIRKYRLLPNEPGLACGAIDLRTISTALDLRDPELTIEDRLHFWIQANVLANLRAPILTDKQRKKFTEVMVDYRPQQLSRASAYLLIASEAKHNNLHEYASYLEEKASAER